MNLKLLTVLITFFMSSFANATTCMQVAEYLRFGKSYELLVPTFLSKSDESEDIKILTNKFGNFTGLGTAMTSRTGQNEFKFELNFVVPGFNSFTSVVKLSLSEKNGVCIAKTQEEDVVEMVIHLNNKQLLLEEEGSAVFLLKEKK